MKAILCLPLFFAFYAVADEAADRVAIDHTITALNESPQPGRALFTEDTFSELYSLPDVKPVNLRPLAPSGDQAGHPTVTISHEVWGEATINLPGIPVIPPVEFLNPRIGCDSIRFITPDVALADGNWTYKNGPETQTKPLLFVMKKEGDDWKIASLRLLAPRPAK
jgi:hypothetical protein